MQLSNVLIRTKVYGFFIALFLLSAVGFSLIIYLEEESEQNYYWVNHTHEVVEMSSTLLAKLVDAETGQRGYLLTSNLNYLMPHYAGVRESRALIEQLKFKTRDNPNQKGRLETLEQKVNEKFAELQETINLNQNGLREESLALVKSDLGKNLMREIRQIVNAFNLEEAQLLYERRARFIELREQIQWMLLIEFLAFAIILGLLCIIVVRTVLNPLDELYRSAKLFQQDGRFVSVEVKNKDEIGLFAQAFNTMGAKVTSLLKEAEIAEKTACKERDQAIEQAISDPLTGLYNRRYMEVELEKLLQSSQRYQQDLSILMFDIDHFKRINDTYGHQVGDIVLQTIADAVKEEIRGGDMAIRYGGEEFVLVLTHTDLLGAEAKAEALRENIATTNIPQLRGDMVTISLGVTQLLKSDSSIAELIQRADQALYEAKEGGRNQSKVL